MRCVNLVEVTGTRCANRALRGFNYCNLHAPDPVAQIRKDALELCGADDVTTLVAAEMLFAMPEVGTGADKLAAYLGRPRALVREITARFRENQIWIGSKLGVDAGVDSYNPKELAVMYLLMAMCGAGLIVRV